MKRSQLLVLAAFACLLATALSATAVQAAPPTQGDSGARSYWLLLDPSRPAEATLPPLLKALAHLRAAGIVLRYDQSAQGGALQVTAVPGAAAKLRHLPGVTGLSSVPPASASAFSGGVSILAGSTITGVVTAEVGGAPLSGINVCAQRSTSSSDECTTTDGDGMYSIGTLVDPGRYKVSFFDDNGQYVIEYYNGKSEATADPVNVIDGSTIPNINATLSVAGHITGVVTDGDTGDPLEDIDVCADGADWSECASTKADGTYDIGGLGTCSYKVEFYDSYGDYATEYYNDKRTWNLANSVAVTAGSTVSGINAALSEDGDITGWVTDSEGYDLYDVTVIAYRYDGVGWDDLAWALTGEYYEDGYYEIHGLSTGNYIVKFVDDEDYAAEYYDDEFDRGTAVSVTVTAGSSTDDIDASLSDAGHIVGTVTGPDGSTPLEDIDVVAYRYSGTSWEQFGSAYTDETGEYSLPLPSGSYRVMFEDERWGDYLTEYYTNAVTLAGATNINLTAPNTVANIDASLDLPNSNRAPVAANNTYTTPMNTVLTVAAPGVLGNDTDADGDTLTATLVSNVLTGMLALRPNGGLVYTPTLNYTGQVTFTYQATDSQALSNLALVTLTVQSSAIMANLSIHKTSLRGEASITYTIVASNAGPNAANGARVSDPVPPGLTGFTWNCIATGGAGCSASSGTGGLSETVGLPPGGIATFTVVAGLADAKATIVNTATITAPAGVSDPVTGNNQSVDRSSGSSPAYLPIIRK